VQDSWTVCDERNIGSEIILMHLMVLLGDVVQVEVSFGPFKDSVNLGGCTVCAKCTMGMEIILATPDGTPRSRRSSGSSFGLFGYSVNLGAR
jgi:hypothetical protein